MTVDAISAGHNPRNSPREGPFLPALLLEPPEAKPQRGKKEEGRREGEGEEGRRRDGTERQSRARTGKCQLEKNYKKPLCKILSENP